MTASPQQVIGFNVDGDCYLNITNRCTLQCGHCPKYHGDWVCHGHDLLLHREPTVSEMLDAVGNPLLWKHVVFSGYGEPTLRLYDMLEVSRRVNGMGGKVRLETDGLASVFLGVISRRTWRAISTRWLSPSRRRTATPTKGFASRKSNALMKPSSSLFGMLENMYPTLLLRRWRIPRVSTWQCAGVWRKI